MTLYFYVFLGGGIGALFRYFVMLLTTRFFGISHIFYGTLFVNVLGSFLMGLLFGYLMRRVSLTFDSESLRLLLATGFLGGFTTFSAFSLDFLNLWLRGDGFVAIAYVLGSVFLSLLFIYLGYLSCVRFV